MHRRQSFVQGRDIDLNTVAVDDCGVGTYIERVRAAPKALEGLRDILRLSDFERSNFETQRTGRCPKLGHLQHAETICDIAHEGQTAETRDDLTQEFEPFAGKLISNVCQPGCVATRSRQARDQTAADGVPRRRKYDSKTVVACCNAMTAGVPDVTMTLTLSLTNSAAISAKRSVCPSTQRYSIATVRPSTQPSSRSRSTKASIHSLAAERVLGPRNPMVGSLPGCCARAVNGHAAAAPPSSIMNSRRRHTADNTPRPVIMI